MLRRDAETCNSLYKYWEDQVQRAESSDGSIVEIIQGILASDEGMTLRVRKAVEIWADEYVCKWLLTFKKLVGGRVVEIENRISSKDGYDLWQVSHSKLKKTRYNLYYNDQVWEVDRFFDGERIYCILAEIELPEGAPPPDVLPPFIAENLLYVVPQGDEAFSNKNLWNIPVTDSLYEDYQR